MSTPISSIVYPGSEEEYLFRDNRIADSETGAATDEEYGIAKLPEGAELDENGRLKFSADDLAEQIGPATAEKLGLVKVGFTATKSAVPVKLDENNKAYVELGSILESAASSDISFPSGKSRWLTFDFSADNHQTLKIKKGVKLRLDITTDDGTESRWYVASEDKHLDFSETITTYDTYNGTNFYVYLVPDEGDETKIVVSKNATFPSDISADYTASNTRKIGQFHTLCVAIPATQRAKTAASHGSVATGDKYLVKRYNSGDEDGFYDFYSKEIVALTSNARADLVQTLHPLAGFAAGDILPESVFCLSWRPVCDPAGMVYDPDTDMVFDIYLQSGTGQLTASEYNVTHTVSREQQNHGDDFRQVGKRMPFSHEFPSMAAGSNEGTNIAGSKDYGVVGGHVDTAGIRMTSYIGVEEACGYLEQWGENISNVGSSGSVVVYDGLGWLGKTYGSCFCVMFGGYWTYAGFSGSRSRFCCSAEPCSVVNTDFGGRGVSWMLREN